MKFKTVSNDEYIVNVALNTTFSEIKTSLQNLIGEENVNISFMARGKIINTERTVNEEGLDNNSTVIIVIRKQPVVVDELEPMSTTITLNIANGDYEKVYTGAETKQFLTDPNVMLNIMHMLGGQNPFLLSYIAVNPGLAYHYIEQTLNNPEFRLVVRCDSEDNDPVKPLKQELKKTIKADENNVKYILEQCEISDDLNYVKGLYLSYNRDVVRTIDHLKK